MQKFIRQIVLVFGGFLYFKFFEGISQFVTPSEAWHDNSDIVWRKKISLNKKQCVESFNIDCLLAWEWPTNTDSPEKRRLTNARGSTEDDQWGVTTQSASDWLKQVSLLKLWIYENHIYRVKNYLKEDHRSCIRNLCMQLRKESLKKNQAIITHKSWLEWGKEVPT